MTERATAAPFGSDYRSGPLQETVTLPGHVLRLFWKPHDADGKVYWIDFELYAVLLTVGGVPQFQRRDSNHSPDPVEDFADAEMVAQGFVKWDGCTQFDVNSVHIDDSAELEEKFGAIRETRRRCAERLFPGAIVRKEYDW